MVLNYSRSLAEDFAGEYQDGARGREPPKIAVTLEQGHFYFLVTIGLCQKIHLNVTDWSYWHLVRRGQGRPVNTL